MNTNTIIYSILLLSILYNLFFDNSIIEHNKGNRCNKDLRRKCKNKCSLKKCDETTCSKYIKKKEKCDVNTCQQFITYNNCNTDEIKKEFITDNNCKNFFNSEYYKGNYKLIEKDNRECGPPNKKCGPNKCCSKDYKCGGKIGVKDNKFCIDYQGINDGKYDNYIIKNLNQYNSTSELYFEMNNKILVLTTNYIEGDSAKRDVAVIDCECNDNITDCMTENHVQISFEKPEDIKGAFYIKGTSKKPDHWYNKTRYLAISALFSSRKTLIWDDDPKWKVLFKLKQNLGKDKYNLQALHGGKWINICFSTYKKKDEKYGKCSAHIGILENDNSNILYIYNTKIIDKINELFSD